ncbi:MAG: nucleotidyltransferase family protein [Bacteroidales bacterium]|jgi:hypothetical protein|nr:nucleotidyltransferase family protein [Bacteroidales bacterium]
MINNKNYIERDIIRICAKVKYDESDLLELKELLSYNLDWGYFLYACLHHRIIPIVYNAFEQVNGLKYIEKHVRRIMKTECIRIKEKNTILYNEICKINKCLQQNNLHVTNLKGAIVARLLYGELSFREFSDIDYLVEKKDIKAISDCLISLGYVQGEYDFTSNTIREYSRKEIIKHTMNSHECSEFVMLSNSDYCRSIIIDLNHQIIWNEFLKNKNKINIKEFFSNSISFDMDGFVGYHLSNEYQFVQLCSHLYSEAVYFCFDPFWARDKSDINLIKLCDIFLLIKQGLLNWDKILEIADRMSLNEPICYTLDCIKEFYNIMLPFDPHTYFKIKSNSLINKYLNESYEIMEWECSFEERIFDINKKVLELRRKKIGVFACD